MYRTSVFIKQYYGGKILETVPVLTVNWYYCAPLDFGLRVPVSPGHLVFSQVPVPWGILYTCIYVQLSGTNHRYCTSRYLSVNIEMFTDVYPGTDLQTNSDTGLRILQ